MRESHGVVADMFQDVQANDGVEIVALKIRKRRIKNIQAPGNDVGAARVSERALLNAGLFHIDTHYQVAVLQQLGHVSYAATDLQDTPADLVFRKLVLPLKIP